MGINILLIETFILIIFVKCSKISLLYILQNVNIANEVTRRVYMINSSHQELSNKYEAIKEALENEKHERLRLQERVKELEQDFVESKSANAKLARDLEAKEKEMISLNKLLKHE